jgi:hypothetical protein
MAITGKSGTTTRIPTVRASKPLSRVPRGNRGSGQKKDEERGRKRNNSPYKKIAGNGTKIIRPLSEVTAAFFMAYPGFGIMQILQLSDESPIDCMQTFPNRQNKKQTPPKSCHIMKTMGMSHGKIAKLPMNADYSTAFH